MTRPPETRRRQRATAIGLATALALAAVLSGGCGGGGVSGGGVGDAPGTPDAGGTEGRPLQGPALERQSSGTSALLQAVSPVDENVVWLSGHRGTWARTLDGGATWETGVVPGADTLQFRDVHAHSAELAWLLSAGPGEMSRIYRTDDGGASWRLQWTNPEPAGFYDCLDFWDEDVGVVYGDAVEGKLRILRTVDGGASWTILSADALPRAQTDEGGFAASGTCLVTGSEGHAWIATGNARLARVLHTEDWGESWTVFDTPIPGGEGAGLFSVSFLDPLHGAIFGGDLGEAADDGPTPPRVAVSEDGGASWDPAGQPVFEGAVFGGAWVPGSDPPAMLAVGPGGAAWSSDAGRSWTHADSAAYWGLGFVSPEAGWLVGPDGRVTKISFR